jgi:hypothetical protein
LSDVKWPTLIDFGEYNNTRKLGMRIARYGRVEDVDALIGHSVRSVVIMGEQYVRTHSAITSSFGGHIFE